MMHWSGCDADARWVAAARELVPRLATTAAAHDATGEFVADEIALLRDVGFLSMLVPAELGGGGATHAEAAAALSVLAHGCPSTALTLSMHSHLVAAQVWRHHRGLPAPLLAKVVATNPTLVSTGASDWLASNGEVDAVDGGFVVSARKSPASGAPAGDVLVASARWDGAPDGPQVIHFSVPFDAPGVRVEGTWDALGMRATGSDTVVLDRVFVPEAAVSLTRPAGAWHPVWATVVGAAMPLIMSVYVGVAEAAVDRATRLAHMSSDLAAVAPLVGRMHDRLHVAQDVCGAMVALSDDLRFEATVDHAAAVLSRKSMVTEATIAACGLALGAAGGAGFARASGLERLVRDVQAARYHPLAAAKQELFTGRVALGLDPVPATPEPALV